MKRTDQFFIRGADGIHANLIDSEYASVVITLPSAESYTPSISCPVIYNVVSNRIQPIRIVKITKFVPGSPCCLIP